MNPYEALPLYDQKNLEAYNQYGVASPGPHVFGVAAATYRGLLDARSQSVIISGESGAGKTETAKRFLQFLAYAATQGTGSSNEGLEERVIATSPLLEAFGNAQTIMNNNSSRYGKYLMLQFDLSGKIMGASIRTYLLEKTRVVKQNKGEVSRKHASSSTLSHHRHSTSLHPTHHSPLPTLHSATTTSSIT